MKKRMTFFAILCMLLGTSHLFAQNGTVQQPVFRNFSVGTTVSVPDRGSAHLGSISRAVSGSKNIGFYRPGSAVGKIHEHAGASSHVYIHDFEAMDQYLLNQGTFQTASRYSFSTRRKSTAYSLLFQRKKLRPMRSNVSSSSRSPAVSRASKVARSMKLAKRAEQRGKLSLARLHYRVAAKYGSNIASKRILELARKEKSSTSTAATNRRSMRYPSTNNQ